MNPPTWLDGVNVSLQLAAWQQFGLAFLLGSFAVATWSDLKRMSAQREFVEIWLVFIAAMLLFDVYHAYHGHSSNPAVAIKWGLIRIFSLMSWGRCGYLFRMAPADVAALAAAASLLPPVLVVLFYVAAKLIAMFIGPWLARGKPFWPFMPVVSLATLAVLAFGWWW
ncbi:MAG: hypothetical protein HY289_07400 [Planctomycetes bacterium]|nr:hypothetical protein [Planctomycetota bacterium]